ncbi:MAG: zf-TFIIB domain-containing protein, partial [Chloroflexota bacterium]|nr:zf-TFIIB domain-containing protein [Chloroflexota bacterium]
AESKRRCPICGRKMKKTTVGQQPEILIDFCPQGDGLWFDGGEMGQLLKQLAERAPAEPGSQQQVITFLGEVFQARE